MMTTVSENNVTTLTMRFDLPDGTFLVSEVSRSAWGGPRWNSTTTRFLTLTGESLNTPGSSAGHTYEDTLAHVHRVHEGLLERVNELLEIANDSVIIN